MRIGLLFSGQGAQYPGMGKSLYDNSPAAKKVFDETGEDIKDWCFNGTKEILRQTRVTQPCVFSVSMAAYEALLESAPKQFKPEAAAGFSLGEYSAMTATGVIDGVTNGLSIVKQRGDLMSSTGGSGGMVAAFGKRSEILKCVEAAREDGILEGVNFNTPTQTVVAGQTEALLRFREKAAKNRVKTVPLSVSTAFHSPMMEPAAEPLKKILKQAGLAEPSIKLYSNVTGTEIGKDIAEIMAKQVKSPVMWQETILNMALSGIEVLIELGPGTSLSGMVKKITHKIVTLNVEDAESLKKTVDALSGMSDGGKKC